MESNATHLTNAEKKGGADSRQRRGSMAGGVEMEVVSLSGQNAGVLGDHGRLFGGLTGALVGLGRQPRHLPDLMVDPLHQPGLIAHQLIDLSDALVDLLAALRDPGDALARCHRVSDRLFDPGQLGIPSRWRRAG